LEIVFENRQKGGFLIGLENKTTMPYKGTYKKEANDAYQISRSGIENYINCQRCFYLDKRLGVKQPPGYPFSLNAAVDHLLKKEFDIHRAKGSQHPLMKKYGIDAVPFDHEKMGTWRENFQGVQFYHEKTNLNVTGAVDDIWVDPKGELMVVDYKATAKNDEVNLDAEWQMGYKRQMEVYQWLLRKNDFKVSDTGYFVYCNGKKDREAFDGKLEFDIKVIPYTGSDEWIEETLVNIKKLLNTEKVPDFTPECEYCSYQRKVQKLR
jgi:CRISPR/Cas system-associated exonuclease Cas4 (RecB family)